MKIQKFLFLIVAMSWLISARAQVKIPENELEKYSYLLYSYIDNRKISVGTGFFIRQNNQLFLFSAYHVFTGWSPINNLFKNPPPDSLFLRLYRVKDSKQDSIAIPLNDLKNRIEKFQHFERPDIYCMKVSIPDSIKIWSIEEFIFADQFKVQPQSVLMYGFAAYSMSGRGFYSSVIRPVRLPGLVFAGLKDRISWNQKPDSINYIIQYSGGSTEGCSGAPVFFRNQKRKRSEPGFSFGGVLVGGSRQGAEPRLVVVKPEAIMEILKKGNN